MSAGKKRGVTDGRLPSVTALICTYNGAARIDKVLRHLAAQQTSPALYWEVVLVDNASTDGVGALAQRLWETLGTDKLLRVIQEPRRGLRFARERGLGVATTDLVVFVDDDNCLDSSWFQIASGLMAENPGIGALGGYNEAEFEAPPPEWFEHLQAHFAVGPQAARAGDVTECPGQLCGAGMTVRLEAWATVAEVASGALLTGRTGAALTSGEDYELCYLLRLAGWRLWYSTALRMKHVLPAGRLNWSYLLRLWRSHGPTNLVFDAYLEVLSTKAVDLVPGVRPWLWQRAAVLAIARFCRYHLISWVKAHLYDAEGDEQVLYGEYQLSRFFYLIRVRGAYNQSVVRVRRMAQRLRSESSARQTLRATAEEQP